MTSRVSQHREEGRGMLLPGKSGNHDLGFTLGINLHDVDGLLRDTSQDRRILFL
jgi:hypothetical protein